MQLNIIIFANWSAHSRSVMVNIDHVALIPIDKTTLDILKQQPYTFVDDG